MRSRRPPKLPKLELQHRRRRLQFAEEHVNWQLLHWTPIMFSDESRFLLFGTDGSVRVWRCRGERNLPPNLLQTVAYGGGSLMVWGGTSLNNKTDLIFIRGNLTAERYVEEVVQNHTSPLHTKLVQISCQCKMEIWHILQGSPHASSKTREFRSWIGPHAVQT